MLWLSKFNLKSKLSVCAFCILLPGTALGEDQGGSHSLPDFQGNLNEMDDCLARGAATGDQLIDCYRNILAVCLRNVPIGEDIAPCLSKETQFLSTQLREELVEKGFEYSQARSKVGEVTTRCYKLDEAVDHVCIQSALAAELLLLRVEALPQR